MDSIEQLDALLTRQGYPADSAGEGAQYVEVVERAGHPELVPLARRGWLVGAQNAYFDAMEGGYGPYADLLAGLIDEAGGRLDETVDYAMSFDGDLGVLVGVSIDEEARFYWKKTGYSRERCHTNLVLLAVRDSIERLNLDRRVVLLVEDDALVLFGVLPAEAADAAVQKDVLEPVAPRDDRVEPRRLEPSEVEDLPRLHSD